LLHVPVLTLRTPPALVITGAWPFTGAGGVTGPTVVVNTDAFPPAFDAVTLTFRYCLTSEA
jgi:hypothetical protein